MKTKKIIPSFFAVVVLQFLTYFVTKFINAPLQKYDLTLPFDNLVPFIPESVYIYVGSYIFWIWALFYIAKKTSEDNYYNLLASLFISYIVCALFFIFLPTTITRPLPDTDSVAGYLTALVYKADTPINLFPSMHCLISWFCFTATIGQPAVPRSIKIFNFVFALLVCISTQTIKQHYIVDLLAGVALAQAAWFAANKFSLGRFVQKFFKLLKL